MNNEAFPIEVRWSDIDANRHLRHSVYYDYGAYVRMTLLTRNGLTTSLLEEFQIGPILFREEAIFKREVKFEDKLSVTTEMFKATADFSRWSIRHQFLKADGILAAILTVEGAWIDVEKRKLATPNEIIRGAFDKLPRSSDFQLQILEKKTA